MDALSKGSTENYTFQDFIKMTQTLIADVDANTPASLDDVEPQDYLAFWVNQSRSTEHDRILLHAHGLQGSRTQKAEEYYTGSPEDDEKRVYFLTLALALEALWGREAPVKETLPVVEKAKKSIPKMIKFWEHSAMSKRRHAPITLMLQFESK
ncbi:hypothetical protein PLEOSDRAFT_166542 [Pleurotus ostreatus PC15]|uniref:Uncharacterized protein n=1 Tax=Pleurotus ostreatus (strain PC15) TaxID=1137138 RepID=A0A067NTD3_PLEO1|nr:hypothetical protein PLEOSDRAFT_166542 [Pleurotus ostreatus PC15]